MDDEAYTEEYVKELNILLREYIERTFPHVNEYKPEAFTNSLGPNETARLNHYTTRIIRAWCNTHISLPAWNQAEQRKHADELKKSILAARRAYLSLHPAVAEQIERFFFENSTLGEWNREAPMSKHLLELSLYGAGKLHWPEQDFSLLQDYPNRFEDVPSSIDDGLENCKPVENIKPNQSRTRFRRVGVVEAVNPIWLDMTGEKPKNYIPEYGDERGDFLQGVFNILWIEESAPPNARRAVDEHRKFFEQLKKKEYSSLRDFLRHRF